MTKGRFRLVRDDDCHWFVIPADRVDDWDNWVTSEDWDPPTYATPIDGPHLLTFERFEVHT
jgi:hypothetical protein